MPVWAWIVVAFAAFALYALAMENGALLASKAEAVHELFHDARHFIGVPCH
ncbi:MAG: CbtB-domain containing protein [Actinobacteria bacterium]|nr:CbtB-domain containing protein [Actinomycetota bacterium]